MHNVPFVMRENYFSTHIVQHCTVGLVIHNSKSSLKTNLWMRQRQPKVIVMQMLDGGDYRGIFYLYVTMQTKKYQRCATVFMQLN